jgi:hypothetical protein
MDIYQNLEEDLDETWFHVMPFSTRERETYEVLHDTSLNSCVRQT